MLQDFEEETINEISFAQSLRYHITPSTLKEGFSGLLLMSLMSLAAGMVLGKMTGMLESLPGLILLITPAIGMRGNIFGAMGSRLGTALHTGMFSTSLKPYSILSQNIYASIINTTLISFALGVMAWGFALLLKIESIGLVEFVLISMIGGIISSFFVLLITVGVAVTGHKRGWDIDNMSAPIITAAGDMVTLPALFLAVILIGSNSSGYHTILFILFGVLAAACLLLTIRSGFDIMRGIIYESIPMLLIAGFMSTLAGLIINSRLEGFLMLPALLVMVPLFLEDNNALGGILTSRLSSMLHTGMFDPGIFPGKQIIPNFLLIYIYSLVVFPLVGVSAYAASILIGIDSPDLVSMIFISTSAGLIAVTIVNLVGYYVAITAHKLRLDPDNHSIPMMSSIVDASGAMCLVAVLMLVGMV
ncbi:MAG: divalent cation transporter [ANME-2 cluster archaeon]|nr:divalent cation transporter [ANME-2 cluster archaeon]MBC2701274.1 divalent cation transporter [ANME-2 cluster archaeon]MBC2708663.1 divalent cation transporter [ANME-2 cluster archaeon]MBC2748625.1 divalent cation transporter [ANME-2 cluster archaeon]MBC2762283.1 divalent cation transporter [ANME-2 cluster archaeon]